MITLTANGSFAKSFTSQFSAEIASVRDMAKEDFIQKISGSDIVLHNASSINAASIDVYLENNFDFTRFLVRQLKEHNTEAHLILLSSMSILDSTDDSRYANVLEMTPYAYSKYLAESYTLKSDLPHVSSVRFSTLFYRDPSKDGLSKLIYDAVTANRITIYNNGEAKRNFIPLAVAAQYVEKIASRKTAEKQTYTITAPEATSFMQVVDILKAAIPNLTIENKDISFAPLVLSEFSSKSIDTLGRIDFSLKESILEYVKELQK